jgi:hypothetical protein
MFLTKNFAGRTNQRGIFNLIPVILILIFFSWPSIAFPVCDTPQPAQPRGLIIQKSLKEIHDEVIQMGRYGGDDFIKREFWFELDGVEENKEEHVLVMEHNDGLNLRMTVQVTYFTKDKGQRFIRYAEDTRSVSCWVKGEFLEIDRSDYSDEEMETLLPGILKGIRGEKEILKLIEKKRFSKVKGIM